MSYIIYLQLIFSIVGSSQILLPDVTVTPIEAFHDTTWEWADGTNIFQIEIIDCENLRNQPADGNCMYVKYRLINNNGTVVYSTRETPASNSNIPIGGILAVYDENPPELYGQIEDKTHSDYVYGIKGMLKIVYIPCGGNGCLPQISWKITKPKELVQDPSAPDQYNLPTDIILTKVD